MYYHSNPGVQLACTSAHGLFFYPTHHKSLLVQHFESTAIHWDLHEQYIGRYKQKVDSLYTMRSHPPLTHHTHLPFSLSSPHIPAILLPFSGFNGISVVLELSPPSFGHLLPSSIISSLNLSLSEEQCSLSTRCGSQHWLIESCLATLRATEDLLALGKEDNSHTDECQSSESWANQKYYQMAQLYLLCAVSVFWAALLLMFPLSKTCTTSARPDLFE